MSTSYTIKKVKDITLLNPWEKGNKYFKENMSGIHITNDGEVKMDKKAIINE